MIEGVEVTVLKQIHDERGKVMKMLSSDSPSFTQFGEIYFSTVHPGAVKAWHRHTEMTLNYAVIKGQIKFVLFDDREISGTRGKIQELHVSPENYLLVSVPPLVWNGFKAVGQEEAIVANLASIPHRDDEIDRLMFDSDLIPYDWKLRHR